MGEYKTLPEYKSLMDEFNVDYGGLSDEQLMRVRGLPCIDRAVRELYRLDQERNAVIEFLFGPQASTEKATA